MRIVLVGPRCSGKTTVSELLAHRLRLECIHMDRLVEQRVGNTIDEIVKRFGWEGFRAAERKVAAEISLQDRCVIDAGGGAVTDEQTSQALLQGSIVVYLTARIEELQRRMGDGANRPPLTDAGDATAEMARVAAERDPLYRRFASIIIDTTDKTPEQAAEEIAGCLE